MGSYFIDNGSQQSDVKTANFGLTSGRSMSTELALPPMMGCNSSAGGHAGHVMGN